MKTLHPVSNSRTVDFPVDSIATEFEVHSEIFAALRAAGLEVRGEVNWADRETREHCRFDLVIYEGGTPVHIVEVKARPVEHKNGVEFTRQGKRYREFGIPVTFVYGLGELDELLRLLKGR